MRRHVGRVLFDDLDLTLGVEDSAPLLEEGSSEQIAVCSQEKPIF